MLRRKKKGGFGRHLKDMKRLWNIDLYVLNKNKYIYIYMTLCVLLKPTDGGGGRYSCFACRTCKVINHASGGRSCIVSERFPVANRSVLMGACRLYTGFRPIEPPTGSSAKACTLKEYVAHRRKAWALWSPTEAQRSPGRWLYLPTNPDSRWRTEPEIPIQETKETRILKGPRMTSWGIQRS